MSSSDLVGGFSADFPSANNDVEFSDDEPDLNDESAVRLTLRAP